MQTSGCQHPRDIPKFFNILGGNILIYWVGISFPFSNNIKIWLLNLENAKKICIIYIFCILLSQSSHSIQFPIPLTWWNNTKRYVTTIFFFTAEPDLIASTASFPSHHLNDLPNLSPIILSRSPKKSWSFFFDWTLALHKRDIDFE